MKADEIKISDWVRILFGEVPPAFFIELVIRTLFVFLLLIICMRAFGKRMATQMDRIELVALFSLAAAIGIPIQAPDRGLLPALVIAILVVAIGRLMARWAFENERFEARLEDRLTILINDGVIDLKKLERTGLSVERVFAQLRSEGIRHLGEVKRLYFEALGAFSIVKADEPAPGLSVLPAYDKDFLDEQDWCDEQVCKKCGKKKKENNGGKVCSNCHEHTWQNAII